MIVQKGMTSHLWLYLMYEENDHQNEIFYFSLSGLIISLKNEKDKTLNIFVLFVVLVFVCSC